MSHPIIEVQQGKLKGKVCKTVNDVPYFAFKGIPYAKPPVGELRFSVSICLIVLAKNIQNFHNIN